MSFDNRNSTPPFTNTKRFLIAALISTPVAALFAITGMGNAGAQTTIQPNCQTFKETGKSLCGNFLTYWQKNGGLSQQGYPISNEMQERSDTDGKTYTIQYFERAVFEAHPEKPAPYDVLLSLLGVFQYKQRYGATGAPGQTPSSDKPLLFKETGKRVGGAFLSYWQQHGGLAQQGYPISEEFQEVSPLNGKTYKVQYFERAVFEKHPENPAPYDVLLSQLGTFRYQAVYSIGGIGVPGAVPTVPAAVPTHSQPVPGPQPTTVTP